MAYFSPFPSCCGAQIAVGMSMTSDKALNTFIADVQNGRKVNTTWSGPQMTILILSDAQTGNKELLDTLAALGFVFAARSNNGAHDTWINLFVRSELVGGNPHTYKEPPFSYDPSLTNPIMADKSVRPPLVAVKVDPQAIVDPFAPTPPAVRYEPVARLTV